MCRLHAHGLSNRLTHYGHVQDDTRFAMCYSIHSLGTRLSERGNGRIRIIQTWQQLWHLLAATSASCNSQPEDCRHGIRHPRLGLHCPCVRLPLPLQPQSHPHRCSQPSAIPAKKNTHSKVRYREGCTQVKEELHESIHKHEQASAMKSGESMARMQISTIYNSCA